MTTCIVLPSICKNTVMKVWMVGEEVMHHCLSLAVQFHYLDENEIVRREEKKYSFPHCLAVGRLVMRIESLKDFSQARTVYEEKRLSFIEEPLSHSFVHTILQASL